MSILIVGAGFTGLMTAYTLLKQGFSVTLLESRSSPCQEASFTCSGTLNDQAPLLLGERSDRKTELATELQADSVFTHPKRLWQHPRFVSGLKKAHRTDEQQRLLNLARTCSTQSSVLLRTIAQTHQLSLQESAGTLVEQPGDTSHALDAWLGVEPALYAAPAESHFTVSARTSWSISYFAKQLKELVVSLGASIFNNHHVTRFVIESEYCRGVVTEQGILNADAVVLANGVGAAPLLKTLKIHFPLLEVSRPILNTSLIGDATRIRHALLTAQGVSLLPLSDFIRVQGPWQWARPSKEETDALYRQLWEAGTRFFPEIAHWHQGRYYLQSVLSTPDTLGIVGPSPIPGLWLNVAGGLHGADFAPIYSEVLAGHLTGKADTELAEALHYKRFST